MGNFSSRTLKIPEGIIVSCHSQRYFWLLILRSINIRSLKDGRVICPNFENSRNPGVYRSFLHQNSQIWGFYGMLSYFDIVSAQKMQKSRGGTVKSDLRLHPPAAAPFWRARPSQATHGEDLPDTSGIWGNNKLLVREWQGGMGLLFIVIMDCSIPYG